MKQWFHMGHKQRPPGFYRPVLPTEPRPGTDFIAPYAAF